MDGRGVSLLRPIAADLDPIDVGGERSIETDVAVLDVRGDVIVSAIGLLVDLILHGRRKTENARSTEG